MAMKNKNVLIYGIIAVVVAAIAAFAAVSLISTNVSVKLMLYATNYTAVYPYQTSYFYMVVNNTGSTQVNNLPVDFYLNGTDIKHYAVTIPAHNHIVLGANYTYFVNGTYPFQAIVDSGRTFNIANRSPTQQSVTIKVLKTQTPNVYTSIPNTNITNTQSFTFSSSGTLSTAVIADKYNISAINDMFYPTAMIPKAFENLYAYISLTNGAYARYANNTAAYTAWMQGTTNPSLVNYIFSSFHLPQNTISANGTKIYLTKVNNQTSICTFYQKGWTKIISYYNNSMQGTCASVSASSYAPIESNVLVAALKSNATLTHYQSGFVYTNSPVIGSSVSLTTGPNASIGATNIFQNGYGFFVSLVRSVSPPENVLNSTGTCLGLIADENRTHICSTYISPRTGPLPTNYSLVNTTMHTGNYMFDLYSLVNMSNLFSAHYNGASLLEALNVSGATQKWSTGFSNQCAFGNASIGCSVGNFNYTNNMANVTLTNNYNSTLKINNAACYMPGEQHNVTVGQTVIAGGKSTFSMLCYNIPVPVASAQSSYTFSLNYTINGKAQITYGSMNITNFGLS
ncbi:MAG: hypothetical protein KGH60_04350 [Candidatus Micrarchaeota archaeon]|nr:hypothetical protein [Candidatus Micrarchaeota archaeon]